MKLLFGGKKFLGRTVLLSAALLGLLVFAGAPQASAESYEACQRHVAKAEFKLNEAIEHHGVYSHQAEHARHELHEARERCGNEWHGY
jgi:hypothetical protein